MSDAEEGYTWLDAADEVLDAAVEEESVVELTAEELEVEVPLRFGDDAPVARWRVDGAVSVHVDGVRRPLAEWLRMWGEEVQAHDGQSADEGEVDRGVSGEGARDDGGDVVDARED
jgi:hypothetical protein